MAHIPQPPHTSGLKYPGLRTRIDPTQIPSATDLIELDRDAWESTYWASQPDIRVPLSTTDYSAIDQGNSTPRFVRVSTWNVPNSSKLASNCKLPIAALIQPFAEPEPFINQEGINENEVPVVQTGETGPMRCSTCRAYVNPAVVWVSGGTKWRCNLCRGISDVPTEHFTNLDASGLRLDQFQRPELCRGTVDFVVPEEYWASHPPEKLSQPYFTSEPRAIGPRPPRPLNYIFAFDVSHEAVQSGFLAAACENVRTALFGREKGDVKPSFPDKSEVAIITFDRTVHFYDLSAEQISMLVMPDLDEVFLPLRTGLFVNPTEKRELVETLLQSIPTRFADNLTVEAAMGSAIRSALAGLAGRGGYLIIYQSIMPTVGAGALTGMRNEQELRDTDKEKSLYLPRSDAWPLIADECVSEGVGVSMFLGPFKFIDVGSIGVVATKTGGEIFFHPRFEAGKDGILMESELGRLLKRKTGYNCAMRVRTSTGIRTSQILGTFSRATPEEMTFGVCDADKTIAVLLERSSTGNTRDYAHIQSALLYTSVEGERRVRVCNLSLPVVELAGNVFQYADMDALVAYMAKDVADRITQEKMSAIREDITELCAATLLGYREQCSAAAAPSQLIIPEAFRALPVYQLGILKSKVLKPASVNSDVRSYMVHRFLSMSVRSIKQHLYPRMMALHDLEENACFPDPATGKLAIPSLMRCSHYFMTADGIYLIDNEEMQIIWVGASASPKLLQDLFDVDDILNVDSRMTQLPVLETRFSAQIRNVLTHRQTERGGQMLKFAIVRQNMDGLEIDFADMLVEDQNNHSLSYPDHLTVIHKQISNVLTGVGSLTESNMRSPW